jgi:hypothetical protein
MWSWIRRSSWLNPVEWIKSQIQAHTRRYDDPTRSASNIASNAFYEFSISLRRVAAWVVHIPRVTRVIGHTEIVYAALTPEDRHATRQDAPRGHFNFVLLQEMTVVFLDIPRNRISTFTVPRGFLCNGVTVAPSQTDFESNEIRASFWLHDWLYRVLHGRINPVYPVLSGQRGVSGGGGGGGEGGVGAGGSATAAAVLHPGRDRPAAVVELDNSYGQAEFDDLFEPEGIRDMLHLLRWLPLSFFRPATRQEEVDSEMMAPDGVEQYLRSPSRAALLHRVPAQGLEETTVVAPTAPGAPPLRAYRLTRFLEL